MQSGDGEDKMGASVGDSSLPPPSHGDARGGHGKEGMIFGKRCDRLVYFFPSSSCDSPPSDAPPPRRPRGKPTGPVAAAGLLSPSPYPSLRGLAVARAQEEGLDGIKAKKSSGTQRGDPMQEATDQPKASPPQGPEAVSPEQDRKGLCAAAAPALPPDPCRISSRAPLPLGRKRAIDPQRALERGGFRGTMHPDTSGNDVPGRQRTERLNREADPATMLRRFLRVGG